MRANCISCGQFYNRDESNAIDTSLYCTIDCEKFDINRLEEGFKIIESAQLNQYPSPTPNQIQTLSTVRAQLSSYAPSIPSGVKMSVATPSIEKVFKPIGDDNQFEE